MERPWTNLAPGLGHRPFLSSEAGVRGAKVGGDCRDGEDAVRGGGGEAG